MLEYYHGLLFITTNRLEDFDEAFHNRIHITIKYHDLQQEARTNIWRQHLSKASKKDSRSDLWDEDIYQLLGQLDTNGRDIRNYIRAAYGYARSAEEDLRINHLLS